MKANELRIGNWVYSPNHKENYKVIRLELDSEINAEPIPLTEEWLIRLGFKIFCKDFYLNGIIIHTRKRGYVLRKSVPIIQYVHQLQNLYFALTGEELTITQ